MTKLSNKKGISIATPFRSLLNNCRQIIINIPAAIKKFPHTNVLGNNIKIEASNVTAPLMTTAFLLKFHLPNISSISGFAVSIFQQCFVTIITAKSIKTELIIFNIIVLGFKEKGKQQSYSPYKNIKYLLYYLVV